MSDVHDKKAPHTFLAVAKRRIVFVSTWLMRIETNWTGTLPVIVRDPLLLVAKNCITFLLNLTLLYLVIVKTMVSRKIHIVFANPLRIMWHSYSNIITNWNSW